MNVPFTSSGEIMYVGKDFYALYVQVRCIVSNNNKGQVGNGQSSNSPVYAPYVNAPPGGAVESSSLRVEYAKGRGNLLGGKGVGWVRGAGWGASKVRGASKCGQWAKWQRAGAWQG